MANIDTFKNYCIYREFLDDDTLLIMVYNGLNQKFYQRTLIMDEWNKINSNFTLKELELIFKVCIDKKDHYNLIITDSENVLILNFVCIELIKTYKWVVY